MFSAAGRLVFTSCQAKRFELNFVIRKPFLSMVKPGSKILLAAAQFAKFLKRKWCVVCSRYMYNESLVSVTFYTWWQERNAYPDCCKPTVGLLFKWALQEKIKYMLNRWNFNNMQVGKHEKSFYFKYIYLLSSHFTIRHSRTTIVIVTS